MSETAAVSGAERLAAAEAIVAGLPAPDYPVNKQPAYPDAAGLTEAVAELLGMRGVTTPRQADAFSRQVAEVSDPASDTMLVITGSCRETIHVDVPVSRLAEEVVVANALAGGSRLRRATYAYRGFGQYKKPRSEGEETTPSGGVVPPYMGDSINGKDLNERTPDPSRLVGGAVQAADLAEAVERQLGRHLPAAHEFLSLAYEEPFIRRDPASGRFYSLSGDLLWAGVRTNQPDSEIVKQLGRVSNTTGVKIGANSDEAHIAGLAERLDPENAPGKQVYMLRLGLREAEHYPRILHAINKHNSSAVVIFDTHGTTEKEVRDGKAYKVRSVLNIVRGMELMAHACESAGVKFGGVHLETVSDIRRLECPDEPGYPVENLDEGDIDPRLNPRQTVRVLNAAAALQTARQV